MGDRTFTIILICVVVTISFLGFFTIILRSDAYYKNKKFEESLDVMLIDGIVDSPSVKIRVESVEEFYAKIAELQASSVYKQSQLWESFSTYYVFTSDYQIAYFVEPWSVG